MDDIIVQIKATFAKFVESMQKAVAAVAKAASEFLEVYEEAKAHHGKLTPKGLWTLAKYDVRLAPWLVVKEGVGLYVGEWCSQGHGKHVLHAGARYCVSGHTPDD